MAHFIPTSGRRCLATLLLATFTASLAPADPPATDPSSTPATPSNPTSSANGASDQIYAQGDTVEIVHPYNPKPLGIIPSGWIPQPIPNYSVCNPAVALENGHTVTIDCPIFALVPNTKDQFHAFSEPGFDPGKANAQTGTLGNIVTRYLAENDQTGRQIDATLLLIRNTLADTEPQPETNPETKLLIDKPAGSPGSSSTPQSAPSSTPPASENPSPAPTPEKKDKSPTAASHTRHAPKPKATPTPSPNPTPEKRILGIFRSTPRPAPTPGSENKED
jgi:hypothetical protein